MLETGSLDMLALLHSNSLIGRQGLRGDELCM